MLKKYRLIAIAAVMAMSANTAGAALIDLRETDEGVSEGQKKIIIEGNIPVSENGDIFGNEVTLEVFCAGVGIDDNGEIDLSEIDAYGDGSQIEYTYQTTAGADGFYSFDYTKDAESGNYLIRIGYKAKSSNDEAYKIHKYVSPQDFIDFEKDLAEIYEKTGTADYDAVSELVNLIETYTQKDVVDIKKYNELKEAEDTDTINTVAAYVIKSGTISQASGLEARFNEGYTINRLDNATEKEVEEILGDTFSTTALSLDADVLESFGDNLDNSLVYEKLANKPTSQKTLAQVQKDIYNAIVLSELTALMVQSNLDVIEDYNSVLNVSLTDYNALNTEEKRNYALTEFAKKIESITDISQINSEFAQAVNSAKSYTEPKKETSDSRGSSGSGGGGGGYTTAFTVVGKQEETKETPQTESLSFSDTAGYAWANDAIESLAKKNVISGDGNGKFRPQSYVTREEFVKMVILALNLNERADKITFTDVGKDKWYYEWVAGAVYYKLINGVSAEEFGAGRNIKRADVAVILERLLKMYGKEYSMKDIVFSDVLKKDIPYAYDSIYKIAESKLMNGTTESTFEPMRGITRAETAVVIDRLIKLLENN